MRSRSPALSHRKHTASIGVAKKLGFVLECEVLYRGQGSRCSRRSPTSSATLPSC